MFKKSFKTFDNHVIVYFVRQFDFRNCNYLRNSEPFASHKLFPFEGFFHQSPETSSYIIS